jgi:hypothetical protein
METHKKKIGGKERGFYLVWNLAIWLRALHKCDSYSIDIIS